MPLTIIEAMACGLPVIAYDVGSIAYQLADESGVVIEKGQFAAFLQAIERLLRNPDQLKTIAFNAKKRQADVFSWESAAQKTIKIYENLLK